MKDPFGPAWLCVGRVEDLPAPGAWVRAPLTRAGVLVTRAPDGQLRAFHAVCTHRGSALFDLSAPDEGTAARFTCPYHNFEFELDGRACAQVSDLAPVRIDTAHGFVFVTLDDDAPPLAEALGETPPWLARAHLTPADGTRRLKRAHRVAYDVAARWTIVVENFQESLHFASVHPALEALTPSALADTWMPAAREGGEPRGPWLGGIMPIVPPAETVSLSGKRNGRPFLVPEEDQRLVHDAMRFPNLLTSLQPDYLLTFVLFPLGPERTRVVASTYVDEAAPESALDDVIDFWSRAHEEDRVACERQERGMSSHPVRVQYTDVEEGAEAFAKMIAPSRLVKGGSKGGSKLAGIFGAPYADLSELIDTSCFDELHREITRGLALVETSYTGGTLKWMGVCAPWVLRDPYRDAMHAIQAMSRDEIAELVALADGDGDGDANSNANANANAETDPSDPDLTFGDETERPFTKAQALFLEQRHGVYFPWKVCYHLLENDRWEDKHSGDGKQFSDEARAIFPKTVAFIESLPMIEMGRVVIFGLHPNDHAPAHRDSEPGKALAIAQSISFEPSRGAENTGGRHKRFYVAAPDGSTEVPIDAPIYWFNDMDWHGVHADPWFRYSVRVDGVFEPDFLERIRRELRRR